MSTKEILAKYITRYSANAKAQIETETNPEYRKNREANLASCVAWSEAHQTGKYVGSGSVHADGGIYVEFCKYFFTREEADSEASKFPKFLKVKTGSLSLNCDASVILSYVRIEASLSPSKVAGAANETGHKRVKRFLSIVGDTAWHNEYSKNFLSLETFSSFLSK